VNAHIASCRATSNAVIAAACVVLSAVAPRVAFANPPGARPSLESQVSLTDLDLATPEGVALAHKRLKRKAAYLCRQLWDDDSSLRRTYEACVIETLADAMQKLNISVLVAADGAQAK
jgi:UrcA family protein